ncbi:MAG: glycosyltransferase family 2 protein [Desulfobacterales bacterium]|jgi:glycosyltransferase involved in cell wall biosynthesis
MTPAASSSAGKGRFAVVIPVFNHGQTAPVVARKALSLGCPVFAVDDGSTDGGHARLGKVPGLTVLRHRHNQGKGAALLTGMRAAAPVADWAITLDADGQHDPAEAQRLMGAIQQGQRPLVIGCRQDMRAARAPWTSRFGREFSNFWVRISGGPKVTDSQSGFRIYPLPEALHLPVKARRFAFEVEILVKACWQGLPVVEQPVGVDYRPGGGRISHFHPFFDFMRNFGLFARLITTRVLVHPFVRRSRP